MVLNIRNIQEVSICFALTQMVSLPAGWLKQSPLFAVPLFAGYGICGSRTGDYTSA